MSFATVFAPVFVQVALTLALLFWGGLLRVGLVRSGAVKARDVALREPNWPAHVTRVINAYQNQLELPVLFYLAVVAAFFSAHMTVSLVVLSWLFVASRLLHALVHVTTNEMARRFFLFLAGALILTLFWLLFLLDVMAGGI
ncbi:MAG: MAPEG family protein [Bauldia sp.]|nr:MAPEG family protein [Bauldia sp.]